MEDKKDEGGLAGPSAIVNPGMIGQLRQLSIPLGARIAAVVLAVVVLAVGGWLAFDGWRHCTAACDEKALESGTRILAATILPALVVVYLAFAETGVKALTRKIGELLNRTLPEALKESAGEDFAVAGEIEKCLVSWRFVDGSHRARYRLTATRGGDAVAMNMLVELNVAKVNVVFFVPAPAKADAAEVRGYLREAMAGAAHEGYVFDDAMSEVTVDEQRYHRLIARKRLPDNFLWDPALKLHFAQDLRMFAHAVIADAWKLLEKA